MGIDEQAAAETAVRHLLELGHHRLGVLSLRLSARDQPGLADVERQARATASVPKGRLAGAAHAAASAGVDWTEVPVVQCQISGVEHGRAGAQVLLDASPGITAVFALSDALALGARIAARERGLSVPGDLPTQRRELLATRLVVRGSTAGAV